MPSAAPPLPPGFVLEGGDPPLPPGFVPDEPTSAAATATKRLSAMPARDRTSAYLGRPVDAAPAPAALPARGRYFGDLPTDRVSTFTPKRPTGRTMEPGEGLVPVRRALGAADAASGGRLKPILGQSLLMSMPGAAMAAKYLDIGPDEVSDIAAESLEKQTTPENVAMLAEGGLVPPIGIGMMAKGAYDLATQQLPEIAGATIGGDKEEVKRQLPDVVTNAAMMIPGAFHTARGLAAGRGRFFASEPPPLSAEARELPWLAPEAPPDSIGEFLRDRRIGRSESNTVPDRRAASRDAIQEFLGDKVNAGYRAAEAPLAPEPPPERVQALTPIEQQLWMDYGDRLGEWRDAPQPYGDVLPDRRGSGRNDSIGEFLGNEQRGRALATEAAPGAAPTPQDKATPVEKELRWYGDPLGEFMGGDRLYPDILPDRRSPGRTDAIGEFLGASLRKNGGGRVVEAEPPLPPGFVPEDIPATRSPTMAEGQISAAEPAMDRRTVSTDVPTENRVGPRRRDVVTRERWDTMTPEEQKTAYFTSDTTGLPNGRMFEAEHDPAGSHPHVGYYDLDDFKAMNTALTHEGVNQAVLPAIGDTMKEVAESMGGDVVPYHPHGDEFLFRAKTPEAGNEFVKRVNAELAEAVFTFQDEAGNVYERKGAGGSHGIGTDPVSAEKAADVSKAARKAAGLRAGLRDKPVPSGPAEAGAPADLGQTAERPGIQAEVVDVGGGPRSAVPYGQEAAPTAPSVAPRAAQPGGGLPGQEGGPGGVREDLAGGGREPATRSEPVLAPAGESIEPSLRRADVAAMARRMGINPPDESALKTTWKETRDVAAASADKILPSLARANPKRNPLLTDHERMVGAARLKEITDDYAELADKAAAGDAAAKATLDKNMQEAEHLTNILREAGSGLGRGLNLQKALIVDPTDGATVLRRAMAVTDGKLSSLAQRSLLKMADTAAKRVKEAHSRIRAAADKALARLEHADMKTLTVKDILGCR